MSTPFFSFSIIPFSSTFWNKKPFLQACKRVQRRGWDSNPCALAGKRFSRPPRYDHFDTSPYFVCHHITADDKINNSILGYLCQQNIPRFSIFSLFYSHLFSITFSLTNTETIVRTPANAIITIVTTKSDTLSILSTRPSISSCNIWFSFPML